VGAWCRRVRVDDEVFGPQGECDALAVAVHDVVHGARLEPVEQERVVAVDRSPRSFIEIW
jgi:hypothetical protein